jgi:hypothetical protein
MLGGEAHEKMELLPEAHGEHAAEHRGGESGGGE